jgi:hypothetical protein
MPAYGQTCKYEKKGPRVTPRIFERLPMTIPQPIAFFPAAADHAAGMDTPRDFLERCLARLEEFEPAVGAFVCHDIAAARTAADRSTQRWSRRLWPLVRSACD